MKNAPEADSTIQNEDVVVYGHFQDYQGSGNKVGQEVMLAGIANELDPLSIALGAEDPGQRGDRGARTRTHRTRKKLVYIEL